MSVFLVRRLCNDPVLTISNYIVMKKLIFVLGFAVVAFLTSAGIASAHVTVKPGEVGIGERLNFVVSVPTEEVDPTVQVRLVIPEGVESVRPNAKSGWKIELKKTGEGDNMRVSEIIWSGGQIPAEQRDEFVFSAQAPSAATMLVWKAYQTYGDGDVVAWDNDPAVVEEYTKNNPPKDDEHDHDAPKPWSETKVVDDLQGESTGSESLTAASSSDKNLLYVSIGLSILALIVAGYGLGKRA